VRKTEDEFLQLQCLMPARSKTRRGEFGLCLEDRHPAYLGRRAPLPVVGSGSDKLEAYRPSQAGSL